MSILEGRVALVTGAARGIGAATAAALAQAGAKLVCTDIDELEGQRAVERLSSQGHQALFLHHDVRDESDWQRVVEMACDHCGGLDILVNNAGVLLVKPLLETSLEDFRRVQQINVEGTFLGMKTAARALAARANMWTGGSAIINLSSMAGIVGSPLAVAYCGSKGAIRLMTKAAALEFVSRDERVRVNSVHPGGVATDMNASAAKALEGVKRGTKMAAISPPEDIASAIVFLASDAARSITGAEIPVDHGVTAQ